MLAVELNKSLCEAAEENLKINKIENTKIVVCDSNKFAYDILKKQVYIDNNNNNNNNNDKSKNIFSSPIYDNNSNNHNNNNNNSSNSTEKNNNNSSNNNTVEYKFGTVLVDPPRSGLDELTTKLIVNYNNILYISCNPVSLVRDLEQVIVTYISLKHKYLKYNTLNYSICIIIIIIYYYYHYYKFIIIINY